MCDDRETKYEEYVKYFLLTILLVSMACFPLFYQEIFLNAKSDMPAHINMIINSVKTGNWPTYSIFYKIIYFFSLMSIKPVTLGYCTIFLLTFFNICKVYITFFIISKVTNKISYAYIFSLCLLFVTPIINIRRLDNIYLGNLNPSIWHNTSTIFVFPFSILLFYMYIKYQDDVNIKDSIIIAALIIMNALLKPNYLLAFLPICFMDMLYKFIKQKQDRKKIIISMAIIFLPIILILLYQYINTFGSQGKGIDIAPFKVWRIYSNHIVLSILISILFPLGFIIFYKEEIKNREIILSWGILILSVLIWIVFAEKGTKFADGNFGWGNSISIYILFLFSVKNLLKKKISAKYLTLIFFFSLHLFSGIIYFYKILVGLGYA